jgi:hypothetical protein
MNWKAEDNNAIWCQCEELEGLIEFSDLVVFLKRDRLISVSRQACSSVFLGGKNKLPNGNFF